MSPDLASFAASRQPGPPVHLGIRHDATGRFLPEPGNTVVCHLVSGSATEKALVGVRELWRAAPEAERLAFTPIASLHMTLFQGIIEYRRFDAYWPAGLAKTTPIAAATRLLDARLAGFAAPPPFSVAVTGAVPTGLIVAGATENDRRLMRAWRDALADVFGYRHPDHDDYVFHITFAYMTSWLSDAALSGWQTLLERVVSTLRTEVPVLELRPPAFCAFADMNHFEELRVLA